MFCGRNVLDDLYFFLFRFLLIKRVFLVAKLKNDFLLWCRHVLNLYIYIRVLYIAKRKKNKTN